MSNRVEGNLTVTGRLIPTHFSPPSQCIDDDAVAADAAIAADKLQHKHQITYAQPNTTATAETRVVHTVRGATGEVRSFRAGSIAPCVGAATITVDLRKNGSTILTAVITLDSANTARELKAGTLTAGAALVADDVLEIVTTATAGGGTIGTGLFIELTIDEDAN